MAVSAPWQINNSSYDDLSGLSLSSSSFVPHQGREETEFFLGERNLDEGNGILGQFSSLSMVAMQEGKERTSSGASDISPPSDNSLNYANEWFRHSPAPSLSSSISSLSFGEKDLFFTNSPGQVPAAPLSPYDHTFSVHAAKKFLLAPSCNSPDFFDKSLNRKTPLSWSETSPAEVPSGFDVLACGWNCTDNPGCLFPTENGPNRFVDLSQSRHSDGENFPSFAKLNPGWPGRQIHSTPCSESDDDDFEGPPSEWEEEPTETLPNVKTSRHRKGLSAFFSGQSRSFTCLAAVQSIQSVQELAKPVRSLSRRRPGINKSLSEKMKLSPLRAVEHRNKTQFKKCGTAPRNFPRGAKSSRRVGFPESAAIINDASGSGTVSFVTAAFE